MVSEDELKNMSPEQIAELQKQNCIFCKIIKGNIPSKKVHEDHLSVAILDINPANEGHIIVLPKEHYQIMPQVPKETLDHMFIIAKKISKAILTSTLGKSTTIFVANGATAGQKAPHFMIHIIPRKNPTELFVIPKKDGKEEELETLKKALIAKLGNKVLTSRPQQNQPKPQPRTPSKPTQTITPTQPTQNQVPKPQTPLPTQTIPLVESQTSQIQELPEPVLSIPENIQSPKEKIPVDPRKVSIVNVKKEPGYLYFVDKDGDIARVPMARGGKKKPSYENEEVEKILPEVKEEITNEHSNEKTDNNQNEEKKGEANLDDITRMFLGG